MREEKGPENAALGDPSAAAAADDRGAGVQMLTHVVSPPIYKQIEILSANFVSLCIFQNNTVNSWSKMISGGHGVLNQLSSNQNGPSCQFKPKVTISYGQQTLPLQRPNAAFTKDCILILKQPISHQIQTHISQKASATHPDLHSPHRSY